MTSLPGFFAVLALLFSSLVAAANPIPAADQKIDKVPAEPRSLEELIDLRWEDWRSPKHQPVSDQEAKRRCALPLREHTADALKRVTVHYTGMKASFKPGLVDKPKERRATLVSKLRQLYNFSTATREGFKKNLWSDVPYHFYLDAYAQVGQGRDLRYQVDSNTRYETNGHLSIVVEGDDGDRLSPAQKAKLILLLDALTARAGVSSKKQIGVHGDFADTSCPGPELRQFVREYKVGRKDLGGNNDPVIGKHPHGMYPELICPRN